MRRRQTTAAPEQSHGQEETAKLTTAHELHNGDRSTSDSALQDLRQQQGDKVLRRHESSSELPEDILADSQLYKMDTRPFWKRKRFHFIVGVSVGALAMLGAASTTPTAQTHFNELQTYLALQLADLDLGGATDIVDELFGNVTTYLKPSPTSDIPFMPALSLKEEMQLEPHFPVVLIPGIISSGLESWGTSEKSQKYFRKRMWGTTTMFRSVLLDKESWTQHVKLDPVTGLDPPGVKIRAAQGLDAADYFVTGYWVWARIIENLAAIGYDTNNMHLASYDWRLSFSNLEVRDKYFTKLKATIETSKLTHGRKTVIISHSMGSVLFPYFLKWVESPLGANAGSAWTEEHIESFVNIAGPMMGVPKAITAMLSGETRDTMALGSFGAYLLEKFFSRRERSSLMRSWAGGASMLPKGGDLIWGTAESSPDDPIHGLQGRPSYGSLLTFAGTDNANESNEINREKFSAASSIDLLHENTPEEFHTMLRTNYSYGITTSKAQLKRNDHDPTKWSNSIESKLPNAPSMKIYCMYGVGLPTERSYYYARSSQEQGAVCEENDTSCHEVGDDAYDKARDLAESLSSTAMDILQPPELYIDPTAHDPDNGVETGVRFSDGDGTVPILSLGYMCAPSGGWRKHADLYNPGHSPVVLREYMNEESESRLDVRGGRKAGDHVDILGNWDLMTDILQIVSNKGNNVTERILSDIERYASNIPLSPSS